MADADPGSARRDHDGYDREAVLRVYDAMAADYAVKYGAELRQPDSRHRVPRCRAGGSSGGVLVVITHGGDSEEWLDRPEGRVAAPGLPGRGEYPADKVRISARPA